MRNKGIEKGPWYLYDVPDSLKTQEMCVKAVMKGKEILTNISYWFVRLYPVEMWLDDEDYCNDKEIGEWHNGYKKWKALKSR